MKKIFNFITVLGFIIILGGVGGYENMNSSFSVSFALMLSGAALMMLGIAGKEQYIRYRRRCVILAKRKRNALQKADNRFGGNFAQISCNQEMKMV